MYSSSFGGALLLPEYPIAMTGLGRSTLYRLIQQGKFPAPIHPLGHARFAAWRLSEVQTWIERVAA
jgi:predicted DNA-binding transcriptional regulator AlpA